MPNVAFMAMRAPTHACGIALIAACALAGTTAVAEAQTTGGVTGIVVAKGKATSEDIVVSLEAPGLPITPPAAPVQVDQKKNVFIPHVLPVVRGTTVRFLNNDRYGHNVFSPEGAYNLGTWRAPGTRDHKYDKPGVFTQLCRLHSEMSAFVVVLDTPYFTVTTPTGAFKLGNVPTGKYTLVAWGEAMKPVRQPIAIQTGAPVTVALTLTK